MCRTKRNLTLKAQDLLIIATSNWQFLTFCAAIIAFIIIELPFLNRPFYWDEAWSYAKAVKVMSESGPSMFPGAIHEYYYRGHPLFFYFISSLWVKTLGHNLIVIHLLFLSLSIGLVGLVYNFGNILLNKTAGVIASLMLMFSPVFVTQATFMLPEILVTFLCTLTFFFYWEKKILLEIITGSLLVLTKESGIVLIISILLFDVSLKIIESRSLSEFIKKTPNLFAHSIPLIAIGAFLVAQKIKLGWYLYPEHISMMKLEKSQIKENFQYVYQVLFKSQGRGLLILISAVGTVLLSIKKNINAKEIGYIVFCLLFILLYVVFCSINFFVPRYTLAVYPFLLIPVALIIAKASIKYKLIAYGISLVFILNWVGITIKKNGLNDYQPGFINMVTVHKQAIEYCEKSDLYEKLKDPFLGYLNSDKTFKQVNAEDAEVVEDVVVVSAIENSPLLSNVKTNPEYKLVKRFEKNEAWCEIYVKESLLLKKLPSAN
jgi:4-amino-4-deoxy-L-arabinose transferase-like glycosyltransferase